MVLYKNSNIVWTGSSKTPKEPPPPSFTSHLYRSHGMAGESHVNDYRRLVFKPSLFDLNTRLPMIHDISINKVCIY